MNEFENQEGFYGTGQTAPPKSHVGVIAFLLILVILLLGAVSLLSIWNIKLFHQLEAQQESNAPVAFSMDAAAAEAREQVNQADALSRAAIGISGQDVPGIYQRIYHWPDGVYITATTPEGAARKAGLQPGDIITEFAGVRIQDAQRLQAALQAWMPGQTVQVTFYRDGRIHTVALTLTSAAE